MEVVSFDGKKFLWEVANDCVLEEAIGHYEIGL